MRICIDSSDINRNVKRRHYPLPIIEEIAARLKGSMYLTLIDGTIGLQMQVIDRISQYLTFAAPWGTYKCKRMPFGLASAPKEYQKIMCHILLCVKGAECSMDGIHLHAERINKLEAITETVMKKLAEAGRTNIKQTAKIPGNDKLLVKIYPKGCRAIRTFAKITRERRHLTLGARARKCFEDLKDNLKSPSLQRYFNNTKRVKISVDTSTYSVASVLLQGNPPVFYASKALQKTQQNYSQIEKEAFAILSACKKFHEFIWGNQEVTIETDHKPLEAIFKKPLHDSPPRLHRIQFEILLYNPTIGHKKGSELCIADTLFHDCHDSPEADTRTVYVVQVLIPMFREEWNFQHRISSPHFPRSNGLAEQYVQEAKNLLVKCQEGQSVIWVMLLHHRNTQRQSRFPSATTMGRRTKTTLLSSAKLLQTALIKGPLKCEGPQPVQDKDPQQGATISPRRIPPGGSFREITESLQSTSADPGNQGAGDNGNSRFTSPDFRGFSHDPEHRSTPGNTYEH
ncbi:hypothetical protein PR048_025118 [Dryococelus australis]|uniref:Reverse transcriptase RNase H-like domain-containing protein n=1 Tax=Dryococelus australis TaxID=614101 RepID=A0ABQ9GQI2_9NEOP|nr:hypothetical protein PR048_025118 [Dryococelus australis]